MGLDAYGGQAECKELPLLQPPTNVLLYEHPTVVELVGPELLQVSHLARTEKDFGTPKLVLVLVLDRKTHSYSV